MNIKIKLLLTSKIYILFFKTNDGNKNGTYDQKIEN